MKEKFLRGNAICGVVGMLFGVLSLFLAPATRAQFTANNQTNVISGVTSNWPADYVVGDFNSADCLLIQNSGRLVDNNSYVGYEASGSSNNSVVVADSGSVWSNRYNLYLGYAGPRNSLVISNGAKVFDGACFVGSIFSSTNNSILVSDTGTVWNNSDAINLSYGNGGGGHNSLVISNGAQVSCNPDSSYNNVGVGSNNSNSVVVTGAGSVWKGVYNAYLSSVGDSMVVRDGGAVFGNSCFVYGNKCRVLVTDPSSIWSNREGFFIGGPGSGNSLVISNGASVFDSFATVYGSNTSVVVTGSGSVWNNRSTLAIDTSSRNNSLLISNDAQVVNGTGSVGGSNNTVRVVDGGVWQNTGLTVGDPGPNDSLVVVGGSVFASSLLVGTGPTTCDNFVQLDDGSVVVTNGTHDATLGVRYGKLILNGGVLQVDKLVMTNSCATFIHIGGTLIVGSVVLDPSAFRITSVAQEGNDLRVTWLMEPGATNALQVSSGDAGGGYNTNGFSDIFIVTNNATVGTVTNHLDIGAATNIPSLYYRVRLVP